MFDEAHSEIDEQQKRLDALDTKPDDNKVVFGTKDYADTYIRKVDDFQDFVRKADVPDEIKNQQFEDVAKFLKGIDTGTSAFIEQLTLALTMKLSDFSGEVEALDQELNKRHEVKSGDTVSKIVENKLGIKWKDDPARFFTGVKFLQDKRQDPGCVLTIEDGKVKWEAGPSDPNHLDVGEYFVTEGLSAVKTGTPADVDWYLDFPGSAPYERAIRQELSAYVQAAEAGASAAAAAQTAEEAQVAADSASDAAEAAQVAAADLGTEQQEVADEAEAAAEAAEDALAALEDDVGELESPDDIPPADVLGGDDDLVDLDLDGLDPDSLEPFTMDSREQPTGFGRLFEDNPSERVVAQYTLEQQMEMIADASEYELTEQQQLRLEQLNLMASSLNTYLDLNDGDRFTAFLRDTLNEKVPEWRSALMHDSSVSLESLMKAHVTTAYPPKSLFDVFASARIPILFTDVATREDLLVQQGQIVRSLRKGAEYEGARILMEDALEEEFAAGREKLREDERRAAREEAVRTVSAQASKLNTEALWTEQGLSTSVQEEIILRLVDAEAKRLMNAKVAESFLEDRNFQTPQKLELWKQYKDMLDPQNEYFNLTDEHAREILREVLINAALILVSGGVAAVGRAVATKGLSLAARALIGSARLTQIERGLYTSGRAGQGLLRAGRLSGKAAGLALEGFLFEATHLGLQGEWLLAQEDWVQRTIMSAATLGAFKFAGGVGARANETLTRYVTRVPDASLRAGVQQLLVAGHTEVAAMLMIGAVQKGYVSLSEGEKMEWDWAEELIHAYVAIGALKVNAGAISSVKKTYSSSGAAAERAPRRSFREIREARAERTADLIKSDFVASMKPGDKFNLLEEGTGKPAEYEVVEVRENGTILLKKKGGTRARTWEVVEQDGYLVFKNQSTGAIRTSENPVRSRRTPSERLQRVELVFEGVKDSLNKAHESLKPYLDSAGHWIVGKIPAASSLREIAGRLREAGQQLKGLLPELPDLNVGEKYRGLRDRYQRLREQFREGRRLAREQRATEKLAETHSALDTVQEKLNSFWDRVSGWKKPFTADAMSFCVAKLRGAAQTVQSLFGSASRIPLGESLAARLASARERLTSLSDVVSRGADFVRLARFERQLSGFKSKPIDQYNSESLMGWRTRLETSLQTLEGMQGLDARRQELLGKVKIELEAVNRKLDGLGGGGFSTALAEFSRLTQEMGQSIADGNVAEMRRYSESIDGLLGRIDAMDPVTRERFAQNRRHLVDQKESLGRLIERTEAENRLIEELYPGGIERSVDFQQGQVGHCYLIASMRSLSDRPALKRRIVLDSVRKVGEGRYEVTILGDGHQGGGAKTVGKFEVTRDMVNNWMSRYVQSDSPGTRPGFGDALLEVAYGSWRSGGGDPNQGMRRPRGQTYMQDAEGKLPIEGGFGHRALDHLLGPQYSERKFIIGEYTGAKKYQTLSEKGLSAHNFFNNTFSRNPQSYLVTAGTPVGRRGRGDSDSIIVAGYRLPLQHAYSVLDFNTQRQTVRLANPHDSRKPIELTLEQFDQTFGQVSYVRLTPQASPLGRFVSSLNGVTSKRMLSQALKSRLEGKNIYDLCSVPRGDTAGLSSALNSLLRNAPLEPEGRAIIYEQLRTIAEREGLTILPNPLDQAA